MAQKNATTTHYVVQSYRRIGKKLVAEEPNVVRDERECRRVAERAAMRKPAVIAFSRTGDMETGDFDEPVILALHGDVPGLNR